MKMGNNNTKTTPSFKPSHRHPPLFSGTILEQVLQFVLPDDVARASMVCKTWRDELKPPSKSKKESSEPATGVVINSKSIWKQAVINSNPNVMQAVIEATSSDENKEASAQIDFMVLAKSGLGRKRKQPELHESSFRIEDLLVVLELKQKKVTMGENGEEKILFESLGTFFHNGNQDMLQPNACGQVNFDLKNIPVIVLEGQNPLCPDTYEDGDTILWETAKAEFHATVQNAVNQGDDARWYNVTLPMENAGKTTLNKLMTSVTLFRRDDWRSFCLFDNYGMDEDAWYNVDEFHATNDHFEVIGLPEWGQKDGQSSGVGHRSPFARNVPGSVAHEVLVSKEILQMQSDVNMVFKCILPPPSSYEEPAWLKQFRRTSPADMEWTKKLDDEIAQVKMFQFRLDSISLNLGRGWDSAQSIDIDDPNALLLLLEGIDWE